MTARADVIAEALTWAGVPYRHQGRSRHGVDCVGLIVVVYQALGLSDYDSSDYLRENNPRLFMQHFPRAGGTRVHLPEAQPADVMVLTQSHRPCHLGFLLDGELLHADILRRQVVAIPLVPSVTDLFIAAYRLPGID